MKAWRYQPADEDELLGLQHLLAQKGIEAEVVTEPGNLSITVSGPAANEAERFESQLAQAYMRRVEHERGQSIDRLERTGRTVFIAASIVLVALLIVGLLNT